MALNCESADQSADRWPCGTCPSCLAVLAHNSLDVLEVDAASNGGVEAVRGLRDLVAYGSPGQWKMVLLDEAHAMSANAFNALLKILEEPPDHTVFVLLTTEPGKILPTVASRCMQFTFRRITVPEIAGRLARICQLEQIAAEPGLLAAIADRADGAMRDAVMLLDQAHCTLVAEGLTLENFAKVFGKSDYVLPLVAAMASGDYPAVYAALEEALAQAGEPSAVTSRLVDCLTDLLRLRCGGEVTAQGTPLEARRQLAGRAGCEQADKGDAGAVGPADQGPGGGPGGRAEAGLRGGDRAAVPAAEGSISAAAAVNGNGQRTGTGNSSLDELKQALGASMNEH